MRSEMPLTAPFFGLYPGGDGVTVGRVRGRRARTSEKGCSVNQGLYNRLRSSRPSRPRDSPRRRRASASAPGGDAVPHIAPRRALHGRVAVEASREPPILRGSEAELGDHLRQLVIEPFGPEQAALGGRRLGELDVAREQQPAVTPGEPKKVAIVGLTQLDGVVAHGPQLLREAGDGGLARGEGLGGTVGDQRGGGDAARAPSGPARQCRGPKGPSTPLFEKRGGRRWP